MKPKVLIMAGYYLPGVKAGGPIRSIKNLVDNLIIEHDFYVTALDRDLSDTIAYSSINIDKWDRLEGANEKIYYRGKDILSYFRLIKNIRKENFNVIYLNSFFSFQDTLLTLILIKLGLLKTNKTILAPRGQFSSGALNIKETKKKLYLKLFKILDLNNLVTWHSTSEQENKDIKRYFHNVQVVTISNLSKDNIDSIELNKNIIKKKGTLKLVYIGRIHPIKNIKVIFESLVGLSGKIEFNLYGPIEDNLYWEKCLQVSEKLGSDVIVIYHGVLENKFVRNMLRENHVFISISHGENFGHSIVEALKTFTPAIISDRTPWNQLVDFKAGFNVEVDDVVSLIDSINQYIFMGQEEFDESCKGAKQYIDARLSTKKEIEKYIQLFKV